jgi:hypothetical protein
MRACWLTGNIRRYQRFRRRLGLVGFGEEHMECLDYKGGPFVLQVAEQVFIANGSRAEYFQEFPNPRNPMPSPEGWKNAKPASVTSRPTVLPTQNALVVAQVEGDVFIDRLQLQGCRLQGCSLRGCDQDPSGPAAGWRLQSARLRPGSLGPSFGWEVAGCLRCSPVSTHHPRFGT